MSIVAKGAVIAATLALLGCAGGDPPVGTATTTRPATFADCPATHGAGSAAIDYVDFIQAFGRQYVAGPGAKSARVHRSALGRVVLRSRCSFSALNDRTHKDPGDARDGDTGFLKSGTPIYAIRGWPTRCRLAAQSPAGMVAYLAQDPRGPRACARRH